MWVFISLVIGLFTGCITMYMKMSRARVVFPEGSYDILLNDKVSFNIRNRSLKVDKENLIFINAGGSTIAINLMSIEKITIVHYKKTY